MALWLDPHPLVLASKSEIRRSVLVNAGLIVEVAPADIDERAVEARLRPAGPRAAAQLLSQAKAGAVSEKMNGRVVLGADQVLALGDKRFTKPVDRATAFAQVGALRGRTHELYSGIALLRDGQTLFEHVAVARLTMRDFSDAFLDAYLDTAGASVMKSVGGYQLENYGVHLFEKIEGDHFTILGLPLLPLLDALRDAGLVAR